MPDFARMTTCTVTGVLHVSLQVDGQVMLTKDRRSTILIVTGSQHQIQVKSSET